MLNNNSSIQPPQHEMRLEKTHSSGAEEWYCPECGRRFLLSWPPAYEKVVLEPGDEYVAHSGGKGGLRMGSSQMSKADDDPVISPELREAIEDALKDIDFDAI